MRKTKIIAIALIAAIAVSFLGAIAVASAMPIMGWRNMPGMFGWWGTNGPVQNYARINGVITHKGDTNVTGAMQTQSRTIVLGPDSYKQGSTATAIWTEETSRPINGLRARENFTFTFYAARLVNANVSSTSIAGYRYFVNGTWNVNKITSTFTIVVNDTTGAITNFNRNQNVEPVATGAYGVLTVANGTFTISINGAEPLTGSVFRERFQAQLCNPFRVFNDDASNTVTQTDVASLKAAYGACPGWGNYDQSMDYNFNYRVDIYDIATAAANINA